MTTTRALAVSWGSELTGPNTRESLVAAKWKVLARCGSTMGRDIRGSSEMTSLGVVEGCSVGTAKFKMEIGKEVILCLNFDMPSTMLPVTSQLIWA
jgi:hypothetical protein